jgi:hypothetical protein
MDNPYGLDLNVYHVYEFGIIPVPLAQIPTGYPIWHTSIDNSYSHYTIALFAKSELEAVIVLLELGCTPVKLLNTN